jgi:hypothetical protein
MHIIATHVMKDEPCYGLWEGPKGGRWIQRVFIVRGDAIAKFETDYGPVADWPDATETIYPSFGENSVAQLQEMAERDRHSDKWAKRRREMQAESTLISDILKQEEILLDVVANRSNFGPGVRVQRNDFPREAVQSQYKEKKNGR